MLDLLHSCTRNWWLIACDGKTLAAKSGKGVEVSRERNGGKWVTLLFPIPLAVSPAARSLYHRVQRTAIKFSCRFLIY